MENYWLYLNRIVAPCTPFRNNAAAAPIPNNPNPAPKYGLSDKVPTYSEIVIFKIASYCTELQREIFSKQSSALAKHYVNQL